GCGRPKTRRTGPWTFRVHGPVVVGRFLNPTVGGHRGPGGDTRGGGWAGTATSQDVASSAAAVVLPRGGSAGSEPSSESVDVSDPVWSGSVSAAAASVPRSLPVGVHRAASSAIAAAETLLFSYCSWDGSVKGGFHSAGSRKVITAVSSTSGSVSSAGSAGESSWSALPGAAPSSPDGSDSAVSALPLSAA